MWHFRFTSTPTLTELVTKPDPCLCERGEPTSMPGGDEMTMVDGVLMTCSYVQNGSNLFNSSPQRTSGRTNTLFPPIHRCNLTMPVYIRRCPDTCQASGFRTSACYVEAHSVPSGINAPTSQWIFWTVYKPQNPS